MNRLAAIGAIGRRILTTLKVLGIFGAGWALGSGYGSAICFYEPTARAALRSIGIPL